jgi:hypothetical protein
VASESWLAIDNEDHDKFAEAMLLCQDASGSCMRTGQCAYEGDCFRTDFATYRKAAREIRQLANGHIGLMNSVLREAAQHMEKMAAASRNGR